MKRVAILTTDLYQPHCDVNDHFNLAFLYALAQQEKLQLGGIMLDEDKPDPEITPEICGDPSVESIAQLNYITAIPVPCAIGSRIPLRCEEDIQAVISSGKKIPSISLLLGILESTNLPVDIHMCGGTRDVLLASRIRPDLFTKDRVRVFVNAGTWKIQTPLEYNVRLEPYTFSQLFQLPCQVLWAPCFDEAVWPFHVTEFANYFMMEIGPLFERISDSMKNYFLYMFDRVVNTGWFTYLRGSVNQESLSKWSQQKRCMWSMPGFLMTADCYVDTNGNVTDNPENSVFDYVPVKVSCSPDGLVNWKRCAESEETNTKIFHVRNTEKYEEAMCTAAYETISCLEK